MKSYVHLLYRQRALQSQKWQLVVLGNGFA